jgi:two-component system OmpR family sensor kinase
MPIRLRLALWCGTILAAALLCFAGLLWLVAGHTLSDAADQIIRGRADRVDTLLSADTVNRQSPARVVKVFSSPGVTVVLAGARGAVLAQSIGGDLPPPRCVGACPHGRWAGLVGLPNQSYYDRQVEGQPFRVFVLRRADPGPVRYILVGHDINYIDDTLQTLLALLAAGSVLCLALVVAAAWRFAERALAPIATVTGTAASIAQSGDLAARVEAPVRRDEVGNLAATFNSMLERLAETREAQRRFVSDASHEIRAPLTTIRGNAELLLLDPTTTPTDRADALRDIATEAARLTRLVDGLLALARGDAGRRSPPQPVRLQDLLTVQMNAMAERADAPHVLLGQCAPALVRADPDRLEEVVINLLDNAVKYTPPSGAVTCTLGTEAGWAILEVRDTGIGIHPDDLPHIFERFYRADRAHGRYEFESTSLTQSVPGSGLGLAIARQIVEEAGGTLTVESTLGEGSCFTLHLPLTTARREGK